MVLQKRRRYRSKMYSLPPNWQDSSPPQPDYLQEKKAIQELAVRMMDGPAEVPSRDLWIWR